MRFFLLRKFVLMALCGTPLLAAEPYKSPFSQTEIDVERVLKLKGTPREQIKLLSGEGIRVVGVRRNGVAVDLSPAEDVLSSDELKTLSAALLKEAQEVRQTSGNRADLIGMALPPFERILLDADRPREEESIILLRATDLAALRHEYLHILFDRAADLPTGKALGKTYSHLDFLTLTQKKREDVLLQHQKVAKAKPTSKNILQWMDAAVDFDIAKCASYKAATRNEFDVMSVELEFATQFGLSETDMRDRVLYFLQNIQKLYGLEDSFLTDGPYREVSFDQLTADDRDTLKKRLDDLRKAVNTTQELADKANTFVSQAKYARYFPADIKPKD